MQIVGLKLVQRHRRWTNGKPTLILRLASAGLGRELRKNENTPFNFYPFTILERND